MGDTYHRAFVRAVVVFLAAMIASMEAGAQEPRPGVDWPQFRGIRASGIAEGFADAGSMERRDR